MRRQVELKKLEELVEYTHKRIGLAKKVLRHPSDENLMEYNRITEIQADLKADLQISPKLTMAEEAASTLWLKRRDKLDW